MKRATILLLLLLITSILGYSQIESDNVLYVVDSIPIIEDPKDEYGVISENEIDRVDIIKKKSAAKKYGFNDMDGVIYVFTKEYAKRPDSIKAIPSTKSMKKINGAWYFKSRSVKYSGPFIDYYLNGKIQGDGTLVNGKLNGKRRMYYENGIISNETEYHDGLINGVESRYYEDGTLMQEGEFLKGKEAGIWKMYHPNGQLKQRSNFVNGKMDGESISYYSTGAIKGKSTFKNGIYQKNKTNDRIFELYNQAQSYFGEGNFKAAIKKYTKCIELNENWAVGYFARGTAKLNNLEFDEAIEDFNRTVEIEPLYTNAYSNRAFAIIRKYEFDNSRTLSKIKGVQVIASKTNKIPTSELNKVCSDLTKAISLGDDHWMVLKAIDEHCKE